MALATQLPAPSTAKTVNKVVLPVSYAAWLVGDLGRSLEHTLRSSLGQLADVRITRLPRALLVEADEEVGPLVEAVHRAAVDLESGVARTYPIFHHEMGPVWTGTLQAVFA